ncbi:unnamed protein product [Mytilus coruscus]|uniref:Uncharacterized protein n=1 Tax=Mytilus coruscus TaxID=42192 RepID=A0A6J8BN29_MYTCO|nr:unnamed protein product [Mytilus coruscus]
MYGNGDINRYSFLEDLNMNDNRITNLKFPSHGMDAAMKQWVMQQVKYNTGQLQLQSECEQIKTDIKQMEKEYDSTIKKLKKKVDTFETRLQQEFKGKGNEFKTILQQKIYALKKRLLLMQSITLSSIDTFVERSLAMGEKNKKDINYLRIYLRLVKRS